MAVRRRSSASRDTKWEQKQSVENRREEREFEGSGQYTGYGDVGGRRYEADRECDSKRRAGE